MLLSLVLASTAPSPSAIDDAVARDARCAAYFLMLGNKPNDSWQYGYAKTGALLYAARITGRDPSIDLRAAIIRAGATVKAMTADDRKACIAAIDPMAVALHESGEALIER